MLFRSTFGRDEKFRGHEVQRPGRHSVAQRIGGDGIVVVLLFTQVVYVPEQFGIAESDQVERAGLPIDQNIGRADSPVDDSILVQVLEDLRQAPICTSSNGFGHFTNFTKL